MNMLYEYPVVVCGERIGFAWNVWVAHHLSSGYNSGYFVAGFNIEILHVYILRVICSEAVQDIYVCFFVSINCLKYLP